ncbi:hypothetical protein [Mesorhizobium sp. AA22]|uniref:hypothetical protein n=1 Tax=Mesorhizobium sp. AA22 TaxID=1854057 RepID=UPI0012E9E861|nr:hypothetical protein [Mesorhizobium sp. AA22]QIA25574.1 hypothetical protein A9K68_030720 [Mesorhizobium sp. AA22]
MFDVGLKRKTRQRRVAAQISTMQEQACLPSALGCRKPKRHPILPEMGKIGSFADGE